MSSPLDEQYFTWLYSKVGSVKQRARSRTFWAVLKLLYTYEFVWLIPNDHNRVEDGRNLRPEFIEELDIRSEVDREWLGLPCSVLEMMIALSSRLAFESESGETRWWFWHLMANLELNEFNDTGGWSQQEAEDILYNLVWRLYKSDGRGGLFPLRNPPQDQRRTEIWLQLNAYLLENEQ